MHVVLRIILIGNEVIFLESSVFEFGKPLDYNASVRIYIIVYNRPGTHSNGREGENKLVFISSLRNCMVLGSWKITQPCTLNCLH